MNALLLNLPQLKRHSQPWNELWERSSSWLPLVRAETVLNYVDYFGDQGEFFAVVVEDDDQQ